MNRTNGKPELEICGKKQKNKKARQSVSHIQIKNKNAPVHFCSVSEGHTARSRNASSKTHIKHDLKPLNRTIKPGLGTDEWAPNLVVSSVFLNKSLNNTHMANKWYLSANS